jgi:hypothetical protein
MIAACSVGLFDAALNYLWDELVNELPSRVATRRYNYTLWLQKWHFQQRNACATRSSA